MNESPIRLSYWAEYFWPYIGGIESFSRQFLPLLLERGYEVSIMTSMGAQDPPEHEVLDGVSVNRLPLREALESRDLNLLAETIERIRSVQREFQPDLVHLNFSGPMAFFHRRTAGDVPLLTTVHVAVSELQGGMGTMLGEILEQSDWIVANSKAVLDDVNAMAPDKALRSIAIYHGLEIPELAPGAERSGPATLLCIGRLVPVKGFDVAIAALDRVRQVIPDVRMIVAGEGECRMELEAQVQHLGLSDSVNFTGRVEPENVPELLRSATLVVMPSRWREAFGLVAVEAAFQERAVVAARVGGIQEVIEDGRTGLLVPKEDSAALAGAVVDLLRDKARMGRMGRAARDRAMEMFSLEESLRQYDRLYRQLVSQN